MKLDVKKFSDDLKHKRTIKKRISMKELVLQIGLSPASISRAENGSVPDLITYATLCKWMGCSMSKYLK